MISAENEMRQQRAGLGYPAAESITNSRSMRRTPQMLTGNCAMRAPILLARQDVLHVGQGIPHHGHRGGVLAQFAGDNLVERVRRRVMVIEIRAAVLHDTARRDALLCHAGGFRSRRVTALLASLRTNSSHR